MRKLNLRNGTNAPLKGFSALTGVTLGLLILASQLTTCAEKTPSCPTNFTVGETCDSLGQSCQLPGSKCNGSTCTCENHPGGFYWECETEACSCVCYCGRLAVNSCESLECKRGDVPCPSIAKNICDVVCAGISQDDGGPGADAGSTDSGPVDASKTDSTSLDALQTDSAALDGAQLDSANDAAQVDGTADSQTNRD